MSETKKTADKKKDDIRSKSLVEKMFYVKNNLPNLLEDLQIGSYTAISHGAVTKVVAKPMKEAGIFYLPQCINTVQDGNRTECTMRITFTNVDNPSEHFTVGDYVGYGIDKSDKGPGKAISYGIKYILLKTFGVILGDEDEENTIADESELENPEAKTEKSNEEKARDSAKLIYREVKEKAKHLDMYSLNDYWNRLLDDKKSSIEFIKLHSKDTHEQLLNAVRDMITAKAKEAAKNDTSTT